MVFEKGWFLHKMNKYAPKGYKFVARGTEGSIALYSKQIMGKQDPVGPFISCFSFEMLDMLFGGLLTRRSKHVNYGATLADNLHNYDLVHMPIIVKTQQAADTQYSKYCMYRSIAERYMATYKTKPYMPFLDTSATLIQGLQDASAALPENLSKCMQAYVNKTVWYALQSVFASMPICDMIYYQNLYHKKIQLLQIAQKDNFELYKKEQQEQLLFHKQLKQKIDECAHILNNASPEERMECANALLAYQQIEESPFATPRTPTDKELKERDLAREAATYTFLELPPTKDAPEEQVDTTAESDADDKVQTAKNKLENMKHLLHQNIPQGTHRPARDILYNEFHNEKGEYVVPKLSNNKYVQMLQMARMKKYKNKTK